MKINLVKSYPEKYMEIIPMMSYSWRYGKSLYIGWLFWHLKIELQEFKADF